jgi:membrane associated rhomboid family serine protease
MLWLFKFDLLVEYFGLDGQAVLSGQIWRLITYPLVQIHPVPFFVGMVGLVLAGRELEPILGRVQFLLLYFTALLTGGVIQMIAGTNGTAAGNLAGTAALVTAFATILPELEQRFTLFFVVPIRFRAKHVGMLVTLLAGTAAVTDTFGRIAPAGMLGASIMAWIWCKSLGYGNLLPFERAMIEKRHRLQCLERMNAREFLDQEMDPILEKIAATGMKSLSREERRILDMGSAKLNQAQDQEA